MQELCRTMLQIMDAHDLHIPPKRLSLAAFFLWTPSGDGPLDGSYRPWSASRLNRQITERINAVIAFYSNYDTEYTLDIQVLARRLFDENREVQASLDTTQEEQRRIETSIQKANNRREGQLGLPPQRRRCAPFGSQRQRRHSPAECRGRCPARCEPSLAERRRCVDL